MTGVGFVGAMAGLCLLAAGCRREQPPPPPSDRTLDRLRSEVERVNAGGAMATAPDQPEDPNQHLAALAAGQGTAPGPEGPLDSARVGGTASGGGLTATLRSAETSHRLQGKAMALTTEELFLKLEVELSTGAARHLAIDRAVVTSEEGDHPMARDAQILAGTRQLGFDLAAGETRQVTLLFEVPRTSVLQGPLVLSLPQSEQGNSEVRLELK